MVNVRPPAVNVDPSGFATPPTVNTPLLAIVPVAVMIV